MLDPATARLCVWRLPLEAAFRLFSKLGSLGGSIRERFSRTGRTRPALARPAFSRWLLENDRLRERWPCQWLNVLYFPFSETSPHCAVLDKGEPLVDGFQVSKYFSFGYSLRKLGLRETRGGSILLISGLLRAGCTWQALKIYTPKSLLVMRSTNA